MATTGSFGAELTSVCASAAPASERKTPSLTTAVMVGVPLPQLSDESYVYEALALVAVTESGSRPTAIGKNGPPQSKKMSKRALSGCGTCAVNVITSASRTSMTSSWLPSTSNAIVRWKPSTRPPNAGAESDEPVSATCIDSSATTSWSQIPLSRAKATRPPVPQLGWVPLLTNCAWLPVGAAGLTVQISHAAPSTVVSSES